MQTDEILKELSLSYNELTEYLLEKYGAAKADYFCTPQCRSRNNAVSRTKEGLFCHHIDEDRGGNLSKSHSALIQPFEWQRKERLVYCNYLEHLLLHIKIAVLRQKAPLATPIDIINFFTTGGIYMVCQEMNDLYDQKGSSVAWRQRCYEEIRDNWEDYISLLKLLLYYIDQQYIGIRDPKPFLSKGSVVHFSDTDGVITEYDEKNQKITIEFPGRKTSCLSIFLFLHQFTFTDAINYISRNMAEGYSELRECVYDRIVDSETACAWAEQYPLLLTDYHGYGFPQFSHDFIDKDQYGSSSIDEYLSKAFPSHCEPSCSIGSRKPHFWTGKIPRTVTAKGLFYIVRIRAVFIVKDEATPFVPYKERTPLRMSEASFGNSPHHFLTFREGRVVSSSFVYDQQTGEFYDAYYDAAGELVDSSLVVSMTKEDFALFKKTYRVRRCEILDGCYFDA